MSTLLVTSISAPGLKTNSSTARIYSRTASHMRAVSRMVSRDGADTGMLMAIYMKASGGMILRKGRGPCGILIWISMKGSG